MSKITLTRIGAPTKKTPPIRRLGNRNTEHKVNVVRNDNPSVPEVKKKQPPKEIPSIVIRVPEKETSYQQQPKPRNTTAQIKKGTYSKDIQDVDVAVEYVYSLKSLEQVLQYTSNDMRPAIRIIKRLWKSQ